MRNKGRVRTLFSGSACEELGNGHSILTGEKLNRPKNPQLFLDLVMRAGHRADRGPKIGERGRYRESWHLGVY